MFYDRTALQLFPPIPTTLETAVMVTTLRRPSLTQTACGLCVLSSSSDVLCVPSMQPRVATTVIRTTLISTWCSSAPLRIFDFRPLGPWRQTELGSCMNPLLSRLSTLVGQRTFLGGCLSFLAFFMAMPRLPFHTSMLLDRSRPSNSGVLTAPARDRAGAAMCMRSTPGCGTLAGPSLELVDFQWSKPKIFADVQGLKRPGALGRPGRPGSVPPKRRSPPEEI